MKIVVIYNCTEKWSIPMFVAAFDTLGRTLAQADSQLFRTDEAKVIAICIFSYWYLLHGGETAMQIVSAAVVSSARDMKRIMLASSEQWAHPKTSSEQWPHPKTSSEQWPHAMTGNEQWQYPKTSSEHILRLAVSSSHILTSNEQ